MNFRSRCQFGFCRVTLHSTPFRLQNVSRTDLSHTENEDKNPQRHLIQNSSYALPAPGSFYWLFISERINITLFPVFHPFITQPFCLLLCFDPRFPDDLIYLVRSEAQTQLISSSYIFSEEPFFFPQINLVASAKDYQLHVVNLICDST